VQQANGLTKMPAAQYVTGLYNILGGTITLSKRYRSGGQHFGKSNMLCSRLKKPKLIMQKEFDIFLNSVRSICPELDNEELGDFAEKLSIKTLKKKEYFIHAGQIQKEVGFITNGLIRSFFIDTNGNEKTVRFYAQNDYATHYTAFITQQPSKYSFQCLEETNIALLSFDNMQRAYKQLPGFEKYGRLIAEEILKMQQHRIESFVFQTAEERYLDFLKQNPDLYNRVSLSHLCSYLGIERQTLTRIRQRLARKRF
jgi:CRP-like cAMP-binding protein